MQRIVTAHPLNAPKHEVETLARVIIGYTISATAWLVFATFVGILLAYKFGAPDFGPGAWLTFGRLRPIHTNGTFYGWASIALVGLAYYVASSCRTQLYSTRLAWIGLWLGPLPARSRWTSAITTEIWNTASGHGHSADFSGCAAGYGLDLVATVARRTNSNDIYLSNWYTMGGVLWTCIIAVVAILPWYQYGLGQVAVSGYYMHNAVGMWFTPLALGIFLITRCPSCLAVPSIPMRLASCVQRGLVSKKLKLRDCRHSLAIRRR